VLVGPTDADLRHAWIAQEKVGERVAAPLPVEAEAAPCVGGIHRVELEPEQVRTELHVMVAPIDHHVVVDLEAAVVA